MLAELSDWLHLGAGLVVGYVVPALRRWWAQGNAWVEDKIDDLDNRR